MEQIKKEGKKDSER